MVITARLNSDDSKTYYLVEWNSQDFANTMTIKVQGNEFQKISRDFAEISKLEIYQDGSPTATFTNLDSYTEISFLKNEYCPGENKFVNAFRIQLTKVDLASQVQRLDEQINPTMDVEAMTLEEAKAWKIKEVGDVCRAEIYAGEQVTLIDGTTRNFSYTADDQANLTNSCIIAFASKTLGFPLEYIPYHPDETECSLMPVADLVNIYMTLQLKLTRLTTKCNMLNCMIRDYTSKDDVLAINWDTQLLEQYQERYDEIVTASVGIAQAMAEAMRPEAAETGTEN